MAKQAASASIETLNETLARAVETSAPSVLRVESGHRAASGIAWSEDVVLTASHVVHPRADARVVDADGNEHEAEIVGRDRATDIAVLRASGAKLVPLAFRDVDGLAVGHVTLALARPGRAIRASLRIIGVLGPEITTPWGGRLERYVETDRGLPRGFEGGPRGDVAGRGIGLDTDGLLRGADLAIPRVTLERVAKAILERGSVGHGYLGVGVRPVALPDAIATSLGRTRGALVVAVEPGGPAERAGLHLGDTLVAIDADAITGPRSLVAALFDRADVDVTVKILRAGAIVDVVVRTGSRS
jgi:S1-C subfamily serine protease